LSHGEDDRIPPLTLVMDVTMTDDHYDRTTQRTNVAITHRVSFTHQKKIDLINMKLNMGFWVDFM
jgi:hypothetical protein